MTGPARDAGATGIAAFFDVDNTIVRGASAYHIARGLHQRGYLRKRDILRFGWESAKYSMFGETKEQIDDLRHEGLGIIKGWSAAEMVAVGEEVYDEVLALRIYPGTKAIIDEHRAQGHQVWLVTASPIEVGSVIARRLGCTGALGTVAEQEYGYYTGRLVGDMLHREAKATAVRKLALEEGLNLDRCHAYGDSMNDGPMLEAVGHPCAINPDTKLRRFARERGWPIQEFRKRTKSGRRGVVKGSITGTVWAGLAVARGVRAAVRGALRPVRARTAEVGPTPRVHDDEAKGL
ncbi:HAD family hydrolase [Demequina activiva]|uniref:Hydrolase n=1 Tax=Demequina activiva TaxID=1582364 RepID=A0A919UK41_9MICO|nr:HAD-IB family hydrolase [Demequina activiva]GIG54926.1 hydrolase [Demequina activiva]